ncbi:MAG: hypothetical protein HYX90_00310, partial [Chloroflexi bacterium]|nr:hypothetical protein [Chloroflexota bacterium]
MEITWKWVAVLTKRALLLALAFLVAFSASPLACKARAATKYIVILSTNDKYMTEAATELKTYLQQMSGNTYNIVTTDVPDTDA